jgi:hypothetical protein
MSTIFCSACRQQVHTFATRCPHCTTQLDGWTGSIARPPQQYQPYVPPPPKTPEQIAAENEFEGKIVGLLVVGGMLWLVYKAVMWLWDCWLQFWHWLF